MKANRQDQARSALSGAFTITISRRLGVFSTRPMRFAYAALWCLAHLGGIGARSRRGFGAVQGIADAEPPAWVEDLPPLPVQADSPEAFQQEIEQGLRKLRLALALPAARVTNSGYDMLAPGACRIFVVNRTFPTGLHAVHEIVGALARFRHLRQPDYTLVKNSMRTRRPLAGAVERAAFGLPIVFGFHDVEGRPSLEAGDIKRRASPLWIRPVRLSNNTYTVVLVFFESSLLPAGAQLTINSQPGPVPSLTAVEEFLTRNQNPAPAANPSLPEQNINLLEVTL